MALAEEDWNWLLTTLVKPAQETFVSMVTPKALGGEGGAFAPVINAYRGRHCICMAIPGDGDGQRIASTARTMAVGFEADAVAISTDSYVSDHQQNPMTGQPWNYGAMELLADQHDGIARGWVKEALMIAVYRHDGHAVMCELPYVRQPDGVITWLNDPASDQWHESPPVGRLARVMSTDPTKDHTGNTLLESMRQALGSTPSRREMDAMVARVLIAPELVGCVEVMLMEYQSEKS
jgi:hypothetical protein